MKSSKHTTMIYIDHETNSTIVNQTKFSTINIDKLNMKLIKTSIYLSQFRLKIKHKFEKFNIISNALNKLPIKKNTLNNLNLDFDIKDSLNNSKIIISKTNYCYKYQMNLKKKCFLIIKRKKHKRT